MKAANLRQRFLALGLLRLARQLGGLARQHQRGGLGIQPVGAQRGHHGGQHQALDVGARRVVRAQRVALGGVKGALQQGAKNGRLDLAPVALGRNNQAVNLLQIQ